MSLPDESPSTSAPPAAARPGVVALLVRIVLPIVFIVVGVVGYGKLSVKDPPPTPARPTPKPIEARVLELNRENYQIHIPSQGHIRAHSEVTFTAQVAGRVEVVHPEFEEGAFFKKGDILLELDPIDFQVALISAEAQVANARLNLDQENARAEQARLDWKDLGYTDEPSELVRREPQLKAAEQALKLAEAQRASAMRDLARANISAPFDGRVLTRSVGLGQTIGAATPLGQIFATDYSEVRLPVATSRLADLSLPEDTTDPALAVKLKDGLVESSDVEWDARILRTEGALDANTLELFAIARIEDPFGLKSEKDPLRVGQPVTTRIPGRTLNDVFVIPREAVARLSRIRLVDPESMRLGTAHIRPLWSDDENLVFENPDIPNGTYLVLTRLIYAPDGGEVVIVEDELLKEGDDDGGATNKAVTKSVPKPEDAKQ